jgi:exosortase
VKLIPGWKIDSGNHTTHESGRRATVSQPNQRHIAPPSSTTGATRVLLVIGVLALAHLPLFAAFCINLWARPHYQFFPLAPIGAAFLLILRIKQDGVPQLIGGRGFLLPLTAWTLLAAALVADSPWLGIIACLATTAAVIVGVGGWPLFRLVYPAWCFLFLMVPAPFAVDGELIRGLQSLTACWASAVLDRLGVYHHLMGNVVEVAGRRYLVEEACSGIHSLLATTTCTIFYIIWQRRRWLHAILLLTAAVCWVLLENVARVAGVVAVSSRLGIDLSAGWRHEIFGLALFCATLGLTWSTDRLLLFLFAGSFVPAYAGEKPARLIRAVPVVDLQRSWLRSVPIAAAFVLLGIGQILLLPPLVWRAPTVSSASIKPALATIVADTLPTEVGPWRRAEFHIVNRGKSDELAEASLTWLYVWPEEHLHAVVSLDHPYAEFHDLSACYRAIGWDVFENIDRAPDDGPTTGCVQLRMRKRPGFQAIVLFSSFDRNGRPLSRPPTLSTTGFVERLKSRLAAFAKLRLPDQSAAAPVVDRPVLQVQILLEHYQPLEERHVAEFRKLFRDSQNRLRDRFAALPEARVPPKSQRN